MPAARSTRPSLAGEHDRGQHVVGVTGHRDDVALDRARPEGVQGPDDRVERLRGHRALLVEGQRLRRQRPPAGELGDQHLGPGLAVQLGVRPVEATGAVRQPVEQLADRVVVLLGVLADVERGQGESGRGDGAHQPLQLAAGQDLALVLEHRPVQQQEVVEQLGVVAVVATGHGARGRT